MSALVEVGKKLPVQEAVIAGGVAGELIGIIEEKLVLSNLDCLLKSSAEN